MTYKEMEKRLVAIFNQYDFKSLTIEKNFNKKRINLEAISRNTDIYITFPGYKSKIKNNNITYDYRVNIKKGNKDIALSHVNILIDLYNKCLQLEEGSYILIELLHDIALNGHGYNRNNFEVLDSYIFNPPNKDLIDYVHNTYREEGKQYNELGNSWSYTLDELADSITWIVLQEDINYPMPRLQGRRMSFYRYLEALYCCDNANGRHKLKEVIKRTLSHSIPVFWNDCDINYDIIKNLY